MTQLWKNQWSYVSKCLSLHYNNCMTPIKFVLISFQESNGLRGSEGRRGCWGFVWFVWFWFCLFGGFICFLFISFFFPLQTGINEVLKLVLSQKHNKKKPYKQNHHRLLKTQEKNIFFKMWEAWLASKQANWAKWVLCERKE